jgi:multidrug transporter EmrE-like cation transporter
LFGRSVSVRPLDLVTLLLAGGVGYGLSLRFFILALRHLGAVLTTTLFSLAPIVGFATSVIFFREHPAASGWIAFVAAAAGVLVVSTGSHEHLHTHEEQTHEHPHVHDAHHDHEHPEGADAIDGHTHLHAHRRLVHSHPHEADTDHTHRH